MRKSSGILLYRILEELEVFLVHPGGPFWKGKEAGAWSIPKGEFTDEEPLAAALREFREETGHELIQNDFLQLTPVKQKAGKLVYAWAVQGNIDAAHITSNTFRVEWPYKSGKWQSYPEVDKASWFNLQDALQMINPAQAAFLHELVELLEQPPKG